MAKIEFFAISGRPYLPLDQQDVEVRDHASMLVRGQYDGPSVSAYVPSKGAAEGLGDYRNWRYGDPRIRLRLRDTLRDFTRTLALSVGDHVTLSADRWDIVALSMVVRDIQVSVSRSAHRWDVIYDLEELPSHTAWFELGGAGKGLGSGAPLAY